MLAGPSLQLFLIILGTDSENLIQDSLDNPHCGAVPREPTSLIRTRMIIGGSEAQSGLWPWQIAVLDQQQRLVCGGTLISSEFVLTAAHCVRGMMSIVAGEYNLADRDSEDRQERRVARAFKHPQYRGDTIVDNDIALLKLASPLQLTQRVWPACLPLQSEELESEVNATILGWGATRYLMGRDGKVKVERDDMLQEARVPIVDFEECKQIYGKYVDINHFVCAGYREGRIDSCAGDSGGPLLVERDNKWYVYGVTSMGEGCGKEGRYGIYSKTSDYVRWIKKIVNKYTTSRLSI